MERPSSSRFDHARSATRPLSLHEISLVEQKRLKTGIQEFDRVLGGGILPGSLLLLAGEPGIGKSTLMTALGRAMPGVSLLYVSGEESPEQVRLRAERLGIHSDTFFLLPETNVERIRATVEELGPDILIIDSIQTLFHPDLSSAPGTVTQVRECTASLLQLSKERRIATFLVGHVTKEGSIAGPRVMEHMVDTVLYFEGDRHHTYRILRAIKNRFGPAHELGIFEMHANGLKEVSDPSGLFLTARPYGASGTATVPTVEGSRPLLVEIQALVTRTSYSVPQRTATGVDLRRLQMLLAVLEKRADLLLGTQDVFLNVTGGIRIDDPAADLGIAAAIASSFRDIPTDSQSVLLGEIGLTGEIRPITRLDVRLKEAQRLGFKHAVVPRGNVKGLTPPVGMTITGARTLEEALDAVL